MLLLLPQWGGIVCIKDRRGGHFCAAGAGCLRRHTFFWLVRKRRGLRRPYLFPLAGKDMEEKGAETVFYSAVAPENPFVPFCVLSFRFRSQNALRAADQSGFPNARHAMQIVLSAPVGYLTYEIWRVYDVSYVKYRPHKRSQRQSLLCPPEGRSFVGRSFGEWCAEAKCLSGASALFRVLRSFLPYLFCHDRKDMARGAAVTALRIAPRLRRNRNGPPEAARLIAAQKLPAGGGNYSASI